jgi:hypothetical protein
MRWTAAFLPLFWVLSVSPAGAEIDLPKHVRNLDQLAEARAEAETEGKSLGFLFTDKNTTCGLCRRASLAFVDELEKKAVIVYVSTADWKQWPKEVQKASADDKGKYIPKMFLFSPDLTTLRASVNYDDFKADGDKAIKQAKKALK